MNILIKVVRFILEEDRTHLEKNQPYDYLLVHRVGDQVITECHTEEAGLIGNSSHDGVVQVTSPLQQGLYTTLLSEGIRSLVKNMDNSQEPLTVFVYSPIITNIDPADISAEIKSAIEQIQQTLPKDNPRTIELTFGIDNKHTRLYGLLEEVSEAVAN